MDKKPKTLGEFTFLMSPNNKRFARKIVKITIEAIMLEQFTIDEIEKLGQSGFEDFSHGWNECIWAIQKNIASWLGEK